MKLLVTIEPDETGMLVVTCPAIPGCVSQGRTETEALDNIREAIAGCLATRSEHGMLPVVEIREIEVPAQVASLPSISGERAVRAFRKAGWLQDRQHGSHVIMIKHGHVASLSVPLHRELAPGTLRALLRAWGLSIEQFVDLL